MSDYFKWRFWKVLFKFIPSLQTHQKRNPCLWLQSCLNVYKLMTYTSRIFTTGEVTWVYSWDTKTKQESSQQKSSSFLQLKNICQMHGTVKVMLICTAQSKWYSSFSSITRVLYNMSMLHKVRLLIKTSIYNCWDISMTEQVINSHKSRNLTSGKFTMTMHLTTQPTLCSNL